MAESSNGSRTNLELDHRSLGLGHVIFFVVAAAAPLTAVVGASPAAFAFGNGAGVPGAFVLAGLLYLLFSSGFTAMSHHIGGAGGFYVYLAQGIGRPAGAGGALMMLVTYSATQLAIYALFGFFVADALASTSLALPWWVWTLALVLAVMLCGRRSIAFSGNLLGMCMMAEVVILFLLDMAVIVHGGGPEGLGISNFAPGQVFAPGLGAAMVFVIGSFTGFEATVIFSEEARNPRRTIPRATYAAVALITVFYAFSTWAVAQYYGPSHIADDALRNPDGLFFAAAAKLLGGWSVMVMRLLLVVSLFACTLSLHNAINRYLFALGRDGMLPRAVARLHPKHHSPHVAGRVQSAASAIILGVCVVLGCDPYNVVFSWMSVLGVLGILMVQLMVCISVVLFFRREPRGEALFRRFIAPGISAVGIAVVACLVIANIPLLAKSDNRLLYVFPWMLVIIGIFGALHAAGLRRRDPLVYARLGRSFEEAATPDVAL